MPELKSALFRAFVFAIATGSVASAQVVRPAMVGHWKGDAQIFVDWTRTKTLTVDIVIGRDDRVTGKIGDARLIDGRFDRNRGWLMQRLGWKTDYLIDGKLDGAVIAAENIRREGVMLPLDWNGDRFEGGVNTSGTEFGGAASMVLAAGKLILRRVPDSVVCVTMGGGQQ
jgi:hypothetical protein